MEQNIIENERELVGMIMRDIRMIAPLSKEDELDLAKQAQSGNLSAKHRLIESNMGYVLKAANQYWTPGLSRLDLISEGAWGLLIAVRKFEPERGLRLITYADHWIRSRIRWVAKVHGRYKVVSLDSPVNSEDNTTTFKDRLESEPAPSAEFEDLQVVKKMLADLGDKELQVIKMRYWQDLTFVEIGKRLGVSAGRVQQIEARSLRKMRWTNHDLFEANQRKDPLFKGFTGFKA